MEHIRDVQAFIKEIYSKDAVRQHALLNLFDALIVLSNDQPDYSLLSSEYETQILKQVLPPADAASLYLYPRPTHAHISEFTPVEVLEEDRAGVCRQYWFIPVILSRRGLALDPPTRFDAFLQRLAEGHRPRRPPDRESAEAIVRRLSFWLQPRDGVNTNWIELKHPYFSTTPIHDDDFTLGLPDSSAMGLAFALDIGNSEARTGFFNFRVLPILPNLEKEAIQGDFGAALAKGNWFAAREALYPIIETLQHARPDAFGKSATATNPSAPPVDSEERTSLRKRFLCDLHAVRLSTRSLGTDPVARRSFRYWRKKLDAFAKRCKDLEEELSVCSGNERIKHFVWRVEDSISDLLLAEDAPAPVHLDGNRSEAFSFVVGSDLQFHDDESAIRRFLACVDHPDESPCAGEPDDVRKALREAKFVLLAGDLGDGAAGSAIGVVATNVLGLFPPASPYSRLKEFRRLREMLNELHKPVFAVPGNHDGMVGYGGIISAPLDALAELLNEFSFLRTWLAPAVFAVNDVFPNGPKLHYFNTVPMVPRQSTPGQSADPGQGDGFFSWFFAPRYDGLAEWRWYFGPLNTAFRYRGFTFIGLNSFNLAQPHREGVGAVVDNWGGGVRASDVAWLRAQLARDGSNAASDPGDAAPFSQTLFLFMHHDPRGLTPAASERSGTVPSDKNLESPAYDATDAWGNYLTAGYGGVLYSPAWGLFWPVVTPAFEFCHKWMTTKGRSQQEWMQGYGAQDLVDAITEDPVPRSPRRSYVFFGHDDIPRPWHRHQDLDPWNFEKPSTGECEAREGVRRFLSDFVKTRSNEPLPGQGSLTVPLQATGEISVVRLGDVGNRDSPHAFAVVKVDPKCGNVEVIPVRIPAGPPTARKTDP